MFDRFFLMAAQRAFRFSFALVTSLVLPAAFASLPIVASAAPEETLDLQTPNDVDSPINVLPAERHTMAFAHSREHTPAIKSEFALVVDQDTNEILMQKNPDEISSIASITKLMTAMVTLDANLPLDEELVVSKDDRTTAGWAHSSLRPGIHLTRAEALHLALMASENHAAQLLGRSYPGGIEAEVAAMNAKAHALGMSESSFADPTGLNPLNRASAADLVQMVKAAYAYPEIREFSVSTEYDLHVGRHSVRYLNTNKLTSKPDWQIGLQKTGYINAAGRCLVMQTVIEGRRVVMVLLDSIGKYSRFADAQRIPDWLITRAGSAPGAHAAAE